MDKPILIIDDEEQLRKLISRLLVLEGYEISEAADLKTARQLMERQSFPVIIADVKLPDGDGVDFTGEFKKGYPGSEIILLTAYGNIQDGVKAMKLGAYDYLVKGDDNDKLIPLVNRAFEKSSLYQTVIQLRDKIIRGFHFEDILGKSPLFLESVHQARLVAATDTTVLLTGESGTGKELFAQAIHYEGSRKLKNFVAVNCSAFSREMLESELFGHKAGSFTGAIRDKKGLLEEANGGTLFLDEIGEMHPELQAKILRVIENREFYKIGETRPRQADVRIIAATNRNLEAEMEKGNFRTDLFYRLSAFRIHLPSLNQRKPDIRELTMFFVGQISARLKKKAPLVRDEFIKILEQHHWKGNIRELKNVIERSLILTEGPELLPGTLPFTHDAASGEPGGFSLRDIEKKHIRKILEYTGGNKTETARLLDIGLTTLYRKMEEYNLVNPPEQT